MKFQSGGKGVSFDSTVSAAQRAAAFSYCDKELELPGYPDTVDSVTCLLRIEVTQHYAIVSFFKFQHDRLQRISGGFPSEHYEEVRDLFISKYGKPMEVRNRNVQTNGGGVFEQEELIWMGKKESLLLSRFGDNVEHGSMTFIPTATLVENEQKANEQKSKALE